MFKKYLRMQLQGLALTGGYEYKIEISRICASIKKLSCFSSTLNCVIVKKSLAGCAKERDFTMDH